MDTMVALSSMEDGELGGLGGKLINDSPIEVAIEDGLVRIIVSGDSVDRDRKSVV